MLCSDCAYKEAYFQFFSSVIIILHHQQKFINIDYSHLLNSICIEYKALYLYKAGVSEERLHGGG